MNLDTLIQQAWADHPNKTAEVAERLESGVELVTDGEGAAKFMHLVNHVVGDHLGRREDAERLCEAALQRAGDEPGTAPYVHVAVARTLAGNEPGAEDALARLADDPAQRVRVGLLVALGHGLAGDWQKAAQMYDEQMTRSDALPEGHSAERSFAIVSNNIASEILNAAQRSEVTDALMERAAHAARTYWLKVGNWVNDERADYLLALVHNRLGRHADARTFAERALRTIADADGEEKVDEAFVHLARAAACRDLGRLDDQANSIARAEQLAEGFEGQGLLDWFQDELAKAR